MAVNKILDFEAPKNKKEVKRYIGLINLGCHWTNKMNASCLNLRALAGSKSEWTCNQILEKEFKQTEN